MIELSTIFTLKGAILFLGGGFYFFTEGRNKVMEWLGALGLIALFMWGLATFTLTDKQMIFYLLAFMTYLIYKVWMGNKLQTQSIGIKSITGWRFNLLSIMLGGVLFTIAYILSGTKGQMMGVAPLAIDSVSTFKDWITLQFSPLISGALGIIENSFFIVIMTVLVEAKEVGKGFFNLLNAVPFIGQFSYIFMFIMPYLVTSLGFGLFHIVAYALSWTKILWAALMMGLMIATYYGTNKDLTAANVFHFFWNGILTLKEALQIIK